MLFYFCKNSETAQTNTEHRPSQTYTDEHANTDLHKITYKNAI